jgi:hypothetical protein
MRAGHDDGAGARGDEGLVDVVLASAMSAQFGRGRRSAKRLIGLDREEHQRGQPRVVGDDARRRHALARQLLLDEAAHLLVADPGDQRRFEPQPRRADGDVRGAAADRLGEGADILEPPADLLTVEVDRRAARW